MTHPMNNSNQLTIPPQADGVSDKDFYFKAVASVTLAPSRRASLLTPCTPSRRGGMLEQSLAINSS